MKTNTLKRGVSFFMTLMLCLSALIGVASPALAAGVQGESLIISFPRVNDAQADYNGAWGRGELEFMNGWSAHSTIYTTFFAIDDYDSPICYCIEPGNSVDNGNVFQEKDESFWNNYPADYNQTISPDTIKLMVGRILQYGYTGHISTEWVSQNAEDAKKIAQAYATQILIWETIVGERNESFQLVDTGGKDRVKQMVSDKHPLRSLIFSYYDSIVSSVQNHTKMPSFCSRTQGGAQEIELEWDGSQYTATLDDTNGVLNQYTFSSDNTELNFSVSGSSLIVTTKAAPSDTVIITAEKKNSQRKGLIVWSDGIYVPGYGMQDLVSYTQSVNDPVKGFVKLKVSYGAAKIVKHSEDGKVDGLTFRIQGNGVDQTVQTANGGQIKLDHLKPGEYTVTEQSYAPYEPQESRKVTVVSGQTATVTFSNVLKRGDLEVVKSSEDNMSEGITFHLYGRSLSGLPVDEYAVTDGTGRAVFKDVLISGDTPYILEECNTDIKYVLPDSKQAVIEWNKATQLTVENVLKKWRVEVKKSDSEAKAAQGDASLAGAVYGIYKGDRLVDTYTTDISGRFTTKYYTCDSDWSLREISPSEGYLLDETVHHIGAEPGRYTAEYNSIAMNVKETVKKGQIAIIKHSDDGSTGIETPEAGAEFEIYLKSAGGYEAAKETERDRLVCDAYGFAQSKPLPYGFYTIHQVKGWDATEYIDDFDVYIASDGMVYRFLINNADFESRVMIVKKDAETGVTVPSAGHGYQLYDPQGQKITMTLTYPQVIEIDTFYTDSQGYLITPEPLPYGKGYLLVEVQTVEPYVLDKTPVYFDISPESAEEHEGVTVVAVEKSNMPQKGTITLYKDGEVFAGVTVTEKEDGTQIYQPVYEKAGLAGGVYDIIATEDVVSGGVLRYKQGDVAATITTGPDGSATSPPLYLSTYKIVERQSPYGMVLNTEPVTVTLSYAGQHVEMTAAQTHITNERQKAEVSLSKLLAQDERFDIGTQDEILSVQFGLFAAENLVAADGSVIPQDGLLGTADCDVNGFAVFETDIPVGAALYIKEIAADSHYILSDEKYPVVFEYAGQNAAFVEIEANGGAPIENNIIYGAIKGLKIDRETEETIEEAQFGLFCADETEFTEESAILTAASQKDGVFTFETVPYGSWIVAELRPADGFLPNEQLYPVTITADKEIIEITAVNDRIPEIETHAAVDGAKEICATEVFTLTDTVSYKHLIPGKEYVLKGVLMDKSTGEPLLIDGKEVLSETVFTPDEPAGEAAVSFTLDSKYIKAETDLVVFESLCCDGAELAVHADIDDEQQTVKVRVPHIGTKAFVNGEKEATATGVVTIEDTVFYQNLTSGREYTIKGVLMDKSTGEPFLVNGEELCSEVTFTPEQSSGEIIIPFTFDASGLTAPKEIVVFESLYRNDVEIAAHADIEDEGQTIKITPPVPDNPKTGDNTNLGFWIGLGSVGLGGIVAALIIFIKQKKDDNE